MLIVNWIILKKLSKVILGKSLLLNYKLMKYIKELISLDGAMNVYLQNSEEILDDPKEKIRHFKHLFIRGNNGKIIF